MSSDYYYLEPDGRSVRGPFNLMEMRALHQGEVIGSEMRICLAGTEDWQPLAAFPEFQCSDAAPPPIAPSHSVAAPKSAAPRVAAPPHAATQELSPAHAAVMIAGALLTLLCVVYCQLPTTPPAPTASVETPRAPSPSPAPIPTPAGNLERGTRIAHRILDQFPKLTISVLSGQTFPKPDGIEFTGEEDFHPCIAFILPEEAWNSLNEAARLDLETYVASRVPVVRTHPDDYMIIPPSAPAYRFDIEMRRRLRDQAWEIATTMSYDDDPDRNLYRKHRLVTGWSG